MPVGQTCTHTPQSTQSPGPALRVDLRLPREPRGRPLGVVADEQRWSLSNTRAGSARTGTCDFADLLAHEAGVAPGREGVNSIQNHSHGPEGRAFASAASDVDGREVADEGEAGPQREQPHRCLAPAPDLLGRTTVRRRASSAGRGRPRSDALEPQEDLGPDRLRTGVAAPQAPPTAVSRNSDRRNDQQPVGRIEVPADTARPKRVELAPVTGSNSTAWRSFHIRPGRP